MADMRLTTPTIFVVKNEPSVQLVLEHLLHHSAPGCAVVSVRPADHPEIIVLQVRDRARANQGAAYSGTQQEAVWRRF